ALQVSLIGPRIYGGSGAEARALFRGHRCSHFSSNRLGDFSLEPHDIADVALVAVRPQMLVRWRIDQPAGNAHAIAGAHDCALDKAIHAQFAGDLWQGLSRTLVTHDGSPRDHT